MNLQFIHDNKGNTTGVFIPIEEWQSLKDKYADLQEEEENSSSELPEWQKRLLDERLSDHYKNPGSSLTNFDEMLNEIRKTL